MKLKDLKAEFYSITGKASDVARQLALAGIAIIWVFKIGDKNPKLPAELLFPTTLFLLSLAADMLQYLLSAVIWGIVYIRADTKGNNNEDYEVKTLAVYNYPTNTLFLLKMIFVLWAYIVLLQHLCTALLS